MASIAPSRVVSAQGGGGRMVAPRTAPRRVAVRGSSGARCPRGVAELGAWFGAEGRDVWPGHAAGAWLS